MNTPYNKTLLQPFRSGVSQNIKRNWLILLTLSTLVLVCIIVWNIWIFSTVVQGGVIGTSEVNTPSLLDSSSINTVEAVFQMRATEHAKYMIGVYSYSDPSQ
jgi:type III secretory pathway component EscU